MSLFGDKKDAPAPAPTATHFDALKNRYGPLLQSLQQQGVRVESMSQDGFKLVLRGVAPSDEVKNRVWDEIKRTHPKWQDDLVADFRVEAGAAPQGAGAQGQSPAGGKTYTVKPGDTLSKIAKEHYGNANDYHKIFEANRNVLSDPDKIQPGQQLRMP